MATHEPATTSEPETRGQRRNRLARERAQAASAAAAEMRRLLETGGDDYGVQRLALERQRNAMRRAARRDRESDEIRAHVRRRNVEETRRLRASANRLTPRAVATTEAFDQAIESHYLGTMTNRCTHCNALLWTEEKSSMCCRQGAVQLYPPREPSDAMKTLWSNSEFQKNIRAYNSVFAFTSMGVSLDTFLCVI